MQGGINFKCNPLGGRLGTDRQIYWTGRAGQSQVVTFYSVGFYLNLLVQHEVIIKDVFQGAKSDLEIQEIFINLTFLAFTVKIGVFIACKVI